MIPLINKQTQIKFNYINRPYNQIERVLSPNKQSRISIEALNSGMKSAIRPNETEKYAFEVFQSLKLQTKNSLNSAKNLKSQKLVSPDKNNEKIDHHMPQVYQSLHKGEQLEPVMETQSINTSLPTLHADHTRQQGKNPLANIPVMRESQFLAQGKKKPPGKSVNYSNNKTVTSQQIIKNIFQFNFPSEGNENLSFIQNQNSYVSRPSQSIVQKRGSRQIKTFKYQNIPQQKQDQFAGCCGLGISDKMAFLSRHRQQKNA